MLHGDARTPSTTPAPSESPAGFTTPTDGKKRKPADAQLVPEGLTLAGERVVMWNTREQRKVSGNAAPMIKNLKSYLKRHPDREIYTGQDETIDRAARAQSRALAMLAKAVGAAAPAQPSSSAAAPAADEEADQDMDEMSADPTIDEADELELLARRRKEESLPCYPFLRTNSPSPELLPRAPFYPLSLQTHSLAADGEGAECDDAGSDCDDAVSLVADDDSEPPLSPPGSPSVFLAEWLPQSHGEAQNDRSRGSAESTADTQQRDGIWAEAENDKRECVRSPCCITAVDGAFLHSIL